MILAIKPLKTSAMAILERRLRVGVPSNTLLSRGNSSPAPAGVRAFARVYIAGIKEIEDRNIVSLFD